MLCRGTSPQRQDRTQFEARSSVLGDRTPITQATDRHLEGRVDQRPARPKYTTMARPSLAMSWSGHPADPFTELGAGHGRDLVDHQAARRFGDDLD
jgi:hypothetical protein